MSSTHFMTPSIQRSQFQKLRLYLHLLPIFGVVLSLWSLYGKPTLAVGVETAKAPTEAALELATVRSVSRLSVMLGISCACVIACLSIGAHSQVSQINQLRLLLTSSFVGSSYFLVSLVLMFRVANDQSIRLPGISQLSRRLL